MTTKSIAFEKYKKDGKPIPHKKLILTVLKETNGKTRHELSYMLGLPLATVAGRCNELLEAKMIRVKSIIENREVLEATNNQTIITVKREKRYTLRQFSEKTGISIEMLEYKFR
jgi:hypothetical protein